MTVMLVMMQHSCLFLLRLTIIKLNGIIKIMGNVVVILGILVVIVGMVDVVVIIINVVVIQEITVLII